MSDFFQSIQAGFDELIQAIKDWFSPRKDEPPGEKPAPIARRVAVIVFDPVIPSSDGRKLSQVIPSSSVDELIAGYIADLNECSQGYITYNVVDRIEVDQFPLKEDGFTYSPEQYMQSYSTHVYHQPDWADYNRILEDRDLVTKINQNVIDEVWMFGFGGSGFYESRMIGPGAFYCNAPELTSTAVPCNRRFVIMGFNWERGVGEMLEAFGHRSEDIIKHVFRSRVGASNLWSVFIRHEKTHPGQAEVGTVHYAPNSEVDYDWGNRRKVLCRAHTWRDFPNLVGISMLVDCSEWGSGDIRLHHRWWLGHFPCRTGSANGIDFNWWKYIVDPNTVS